MSLYKRGKFWWTDFEHCGQRVNRSTRVLATGAESKKRAEEVEAAERDSESEKSATVVRLHSVISPTDG